MIIPNDNALRWQEAESINAKLLALLPKEQGDRVFNQEYVDIEPSFLGFVDTYYYLSKIVPTHWTVIDFGSAYNAQSFFFADHKRYIAVDAGDIERFCPDNCVIFTKRIEAFLKEDLPFLDLNKKEVFAICNYVDTGISLLIGSIFPNSFSYYPHGRS